MADSLERERQQLPKNRIKVNFVFNLISVVSGLLFPLITFPYTSRILFADGIGHVQFYVSIINYIVMLSSIGIPMYGIRQIARVRDDRKELSKTTYEILSLHLLLSFIGYVFVGLMCVFVEKVQADIPTFLLLSSSIFLTAIGCSWFYGGIEDFKYVTVLGLVVKLSSLLILFTLVKSREDVFWYALFTIAASVGSNIVNFLRLKKYVSLKDFHISEMNIWKHLRPALAVFVLNVITSIYLNLDTVMLGFLSDSESVGYYTAATKLSHMLVSAVTALGAVMLPRMSNLAEKGNMADFSRLSQKSYDFTMLMSFPIFFGLIVLSPALIRLFSGNTFEPAILTLQLISPIVVAIAMSGIMGTQILYPLGKTNLVIISTAVGALANFTLNLLLIPRYAQNGAAIATSVAEISVALTQLLIARKYIPIHLFSKRIGYYFFASVMMFICCNLAITRVSSDIVSVIIIPAIGALLYGILMLAAKDGLCLEIVEIGKSKLRFIKRIK